MNYLKYIIISLSYLLINSCAKSNFSFKEQIRETLQDAVILQANDFLKESPITVTASASQRSTGGIHDYFSEGDYWWADTTNLSGPYIQRDGMTNPANFTAHREALVRFSEMVGNLTSAYILTKDSVYAEAAIRHCKAWFLDENTKMNPNLLYAQAIVGRHTGRGIGVIDGIHFMEVVQSLIVLEQLGMVNSSEIKEFRSWFSDFQTWLTTHKYGLDEMVHPNNHGTCWNMQLGLYAVFTKNDSLLNFCRDNYKNTLLPNQMATNGSFPLELDRTKPYGYSLFNLDAMTINCLILSDKSTNLWEYSTPNGQSIKLGLAFMKPYVKDKNEWNLEPDAMYWHEWPVAHPSYLFGAIKYLRPDYFKLWKNNAHFPNVFEVRRNLPIRNPLLWIGEAQ